MPKYKLQTDGEPRSGRCCRTRVTASTKEASLFRSRRPEFLCKPYKQGPPWTSHWTSFKSYWIMTLKAFQSMMKWHSKVERKTRLEVVPSRKPIPEHLDKGYYKKRTKHLLSPCFGSGLSLKYTNLFSGAITLLGKKTLFIPLACLLCRRELDFPEQPFCYHRDRGWEVGGPPSLCSLLWELYNNSWGTAYPCSTDKQTCLVLVQRCSETCRGPTVSRQKLSLCDALQGLHLGGMVYAPRRTPDRTANPHSSFSFTSTSLRDLGQSLSHFGVSVIHWRWGTNCSLNWMHRIFGI